MPIKILIVDDEPHLAVVIRQVFRKRIKDEELVFLFAADGEQALSLLREHEDVAMVFTDINMPKMNGLTLLKNLNEKHPLLKTVVITAYGDMKNIRSAMNHGAFDFLNKPINLGDLKITMEKTLAHVYQLRDLDSERQKRFLAEKLRSLGESLAGTLDVNEVLGRFLKTLRQVMTFSSGFVCMKNAAGLEIVCRLDAGDHVAPAFPEACMEKLFGLTSEARKPVFVTAADGDLAAGSALLCLPLFSERGVLGMAVLDRGGPEPFDELEKDLVLSLSNEAALAVENARKFKEVWRQAITDEVTGLYVRHHFLDLSAKEIERSRRYGNPLVALVLNVDHFHELNDRHGPGAGKATLTALAAILRRICRSTDLMGRLGGDELSVMLVETDLQQGAELAEQMRAAIEAAAIPFGTATLSVTVSIGVAVREHPGESLQVLLHRTESLVYKAKRKGRNRVEIHRPEVSS